MLADIADKRVTMKIFSVDAPGTLSIAQEQLADGGVLIIPTETLFGLTADAKNSLAVQKVFDIKGREQTRQSAIFLPSLVDIERYAEIPSERARKLLCAYLPGPLTVVLRSKVTDWPGVVGKTGKIGIRVSSDMFVHNLVADYGRPLIATSANKSGQPDPLTLDQITREFRSEVDLICYRQKEITAVASTVVDLTGEEPILLRSGVIPSDELMRFWKGC